MRSGRTRQTGDTPSSPGTAYEPKRPPLPGDEDLFQFCWDYHQGRLLTWNIAGNDPGLPPGVQLGIRNRRAVTTADPAGRLSRTSHSSR